MRNGFLTAKLAALLAAASALAPGGGDKPSPSPRNRRPKLTNVVGPATNWPSGKVHRKPRGDTGQHPKFAKPRKHKPHTHPLRDYHGAFTLTGYRLSDGPGAAPLMGVSLGTFPHAGRRKWLAGISAQRGY